MTMVLNHSPIRGRSVRSGAAETVPTPRMRFRGLVVIALAAVAWMPVALVVDRLV